MCLTAFMIGSTSEETYKTGYRMVLAFNRDELYARPTKPAAFWSNHENIIGGMDMAFGKEGGTWLSMSKTGRLAFLLNIDRLPNTIRDPKAKSRGLLVSDFVKGTQSCEDYLWAVAKKGDQYKGFNLVTADLSKQDDIEVYYYCNKSSKPPQKLQAGQHGISNSHYDSPWKKVVHVENSLTKILANVTEMSKETVTKEILKVMGNDVPLSGDQPLDEYATTEKEVLELLPELVCVKTPIHGTRSHTVILVDTQGEVTFTECYLCEPIDSRNRQWKTQTVTFKLNSETSSETKLAV